MYCSDFVCTYKQHSDEYQDMIYRSQLLQAFSLEDLDDDAINGEIEKIYNTIRDNNDITYLLSKIEKSSGLQTIISFIGNDNLTLFKLLFHFELFDLTHKLICEFKNNHTISREIVDRIVKLL